jgi:hypothetical protein
VKKAIAALALMSSITYAATPLQDEVQVTHIDSKSSMNYNRLIGRVEVMKDLNLDLSKDDDIFFQNGEVVTKDQVDKKVAFCQLDTDVDGVKYEYGPVQVRGNDLLIKKGLIRAIESVRVTPKFEKELIEYDINFIRSVVKGSNDIVDELECSVPMSTKRVLTIGDVKEITGNAFSFDMLDIETK